MKIVVLACIALVAAASAVSLFRLLKRLARRMLHAHDARRDRAWRQARLTAVATSPCPVLSPLSLTGLDPVSAPYSGLSRTSWMEIARQLLSGLLHHSSALRGRITPPVSFVSKYPRLERDGSVFGLEQEYVEAFCRSLWIAGPLLAQDPGWRIEGRSVADYYREYLVRGTTPGDPDYFGIGGGPHPTTHIMEAAAVCIALRQYPSVFWDPLDRRERALIVSWLDAVRSRPVNPNNWRWFSVIVETFLKTEGYAYDARRVSEHLRAIRAFYVDAGWSRDLDKFDYYSSWSLQFYPIFWSLWDGASDPGLRDEFAERNDRFLESFVHIFSRRGELPIWGRSPIYRFGAAAPLAASFLRPSVPSIDPGFARRLASGSLRQFIERPGFLKDGIPTLGWLAEQPRIVDTYSGVTSPYWCAKIFTALSLPSDSPFWIAPENEGFWNLPPSRYDIGRTGMWVQHDRQTGHSRLYAPQNVALDDVRYQAMFFDTADAS